MKLLKIHFLSGIIISVFVFLHLTNHLVSLLGPSAHIEVMDSLRLFYRNVFMEIILIGAVLVQITSGTTLVKSSFKSITGRFEKLRVWSGMYLAFFFIIHVSAVLIGRSWLHLDTNFYFGVAGLNTFPFNLFFVPYYGLAILAFFSHVASIHYHKMKHEVLGLSPKMQSKLILVIGFSITFLILAGLTNRFQGVEIPQEYRVLIGG